MAEPYIIDENNFEDDALRQAVISYKEAMRRADHDLDVRYLVKTLKSVDGTSPVKVLRNPIDEERHWNQEEKLYNVSKIEVDEEHHLAIRLRKDNLEYSAEKALEQIDSLKMKLHGTMGPVMLIVSDEKKVRLTDVYSHSRVDDVWAGLPFEVVLGYFEKD